MEYLLKKWEPGDADAIAIHANNKKIGDNLRDGFPYPYTKGDALDFIESCIGGDVEGKMHRAIVVDGQAVGSIGLFVQDNVYRMSAEIGYWLGEPFWGKGIVTKAVKQICAEGFLRYDIVRIYAEPYAYNTGSRRVLEKAGFTLEALLRNSVVKNGKVMDSCIYSILKEEF